jgi:hypothetical protein
MPTTSSTGHLPLLCRRHYPLVHEGGYTIDDHGDFAIPTAYTPSTAGDVNELRGTHAATDIAQNLRKRHQRPIDLDLAVDILLTATALDDRRVTRKKTWGRTGIKPVTLG